MSGHSYSDKLPGYSFLAAMPYAVFRRLMGFPAHPLNVAGFAHWTADYCHYALYVRPRDGAGRGLARRSWRATSGAGPDDRHWSGSPTDWRRPPMPMRPWPTAIRPRPRACSGSFALLWRPTIVVNPVGSALRTSSEMASPKEVRMADPTKTAVGDAAFAGFLAAYASTVELQVGPVSAILGLYALALVVGRKRPPDDDTGLRGSGR